MTTGTIKTLTSNPRGFVVVTDPGPPEVTVTFSPVTEEQFDVASAAFIKGCEVEVIGGPPSPTKVTTK